MVLI
jgi:hypothetical protein